MTGDDEFVLNPPERTYKGEPEWSLSHSGADAFSQCPLKWYLNYGAKLNAPVKPERLAVGSAWHKVIEYYRAAQVENPDIEPLEQMQRAGWAIAHIRELVPDAAYIDDDLEGRLIWMLTGYIDRWAPSEKLWRYVATEVKFEVPLLDGGRVTFNGYVDYVKVHRETGEYRAGDTKTSSGKDVSKSYYSADLSFEPQFMRYSHALRACGVPIAAFEWDAARTDQLKRAMTADERYNRVAGSLNPLAVDRAWRELIDLATEIDLMRSGERRVYASPVSWVCKSRCDYHVAHQLAVDTGRAVEQAALDYGFTRRGEPEFFLDGSYLEPAGHPEPVRAVPVVDEVERFSTTTLETKWERQ